MFLHYKKKIPKQVTDKTSEVNLRVGVAEAQGEGGIILSFQTNMFLHCVSPEAHKQIPS